jgi:hypothetical protein
VESVESVGLCAK